MSIFIRGLQKCCAANSLSLFSRIYIYAFTIYCPLQLYYSLLSEVPLFLKKQAAANSKIKSATRLSRSNTNYAFYFINVKNYFQYLSILFESDFLYASKSVIGFFASPSSHAAFATDEATHSITRLSNGLGTI